MAHMVECKWGSFFMGIPVPSSRTVRCDAFLEGKDCGGGEAKERAMIAEHGGDCHAITVFPHVRVD
jgi:hypothetical protein